MPEKKKRLDIEDIAEVLRRHSSVRAAARELRVDHKSILWRFRRRGLHASQFLAKVPVPEGMRLREVVTRDDGSQTFYADLESREPPEFEKVPDGHVVKGVSTYSGPDGRIRGQWVKTDVDRARVEELFRKACEKWVEDYRGFAGRVRAPRRCDGDLHVVVPIGDPHVGMLSWGPETGANFDLKIAVRELFAVVDDLVDRAPAAESCTIVNLGDYFHAQDDKQLTPGHGNKLDVDGRASKVTQVGFALFRRIIDRALLKFRRVRVVVVPGNHDPNLARLMAAFLRAVYEDEPRVEVAPNENPFYYWEFGKNLFGAVHGNELKLRDLPGVMAHDVPEMWGRTTHRYIHSGHVHTDSATEVQGTMVYTWRTVAPNDAYAHAHGYRSGKSLCAIAYMREGGEYQRITSELVHVQRKLAAAKSAKAAAR